DGGGVYTYTGPNITVYNQRKITRNIILNGLGAGFGTDSPSYLPVNGIYLDDNSANVEVEGNTVADCKNIGYFIHNVHEITMKKILISFQMHSTSSLTNSKMDMQKKAWKEYLLIS